MKQRFLFLSVIALLVLSACGGGKKSQTESEGETDSTTVTAEDEITAQIRSLYRAIAQKEESIDQRFACHAWRDTVAAVEEKDAHVAEIGFFNDDIWTQMQDANPDTFEVRDVKFVELDEQKGLALVDFVLWSPVQTVHQKFRLCREDGTWRVHNIIRFFQNERGKEEESDMMKEMRKYLTEPEEGLAELTYENMEGIYDSLDDSMNSVSRFRLNKDGTATWAIVGSLNSTEYTYTIKGHTICLKVKEVNSEEDCYEYDEDTRTLKNEQGAVYYRQMTD